MTGVAAFVEPSDAIAAGTVAAGELRDPRFRLVRTFALVVGVDTWVEAEPGEYGVRVLLPTGDELDGMAEVAVDRPGAVRLRPESPPLRRRRRAQEALRGVRLAGVTGTLWARTPDGWQTKPLAQRISMRPVVVHVDRSLLLQCTGPGYPSRFVVLPPAALLAVSLDADREPTVVPIDPLAGTLSRFVTDWRVRETDTLLNSLDPSAPPRDELIATLAGYHLIRTVDDFRLARWLEADSPANADALAVLATARLRHGTDDLYGVRRALVDAVDTGPPAYAEGTRLLLDALERFAVNPELGDDRHVLAALARMRAVAEASVPGAALTTYFGSHPDTPEPRASRASRFAWPDVRRAGLPGIAVLTAGTFIAGALARRRDRTSLLRSASRLALALALALALSEELRKRVLDLLFGEEEEFDYPMVPAPERERNVTASD